MTADEIEERMYEYRSLVADKIRDAKIFIDSIKNPEDYIKNKLIFGRIRDSLDDCDRLYEEMMLLEHETPED